MSVCHIDLCRFGSRSRIFKTKFWIRIPWVKKKMKHSCKKTRKLTSANHEKKISPKNEHFTVSKLGIFFKTVCNFRTWIRFQRLNLMRISNLCGSGFKNTAGWHLQTVAMAAIGFATLIMVRKLVFPYLADVLLILPTLDSATKKSLKIKVCFCKWYKMMWTLYRRGWSTNDLSSKSRVADFWVWSIGGFFSYSYGYQIF
jgi:hypothetical protein